MRRILPLTLMGLLALAPAQAAPAKRKPVSLKTAQAKVVKRLAAAYDDGTYKATCRRAKKGGAACTIVRTAGTGPACGQGTVKLGRRGKLVVAAWPMLDCTGIPGAPADAAPSPTPPAPPAATPELPAPAPPPPAASGLSGTYVCLTGIVGQVRPAGPTSIEPIPVPATGIEPPMKFTLEPDGTYDNITFGAAYANDPKWKGTYAVSGDRVKLITAPGAPLFSYDLLRRTDTAGTEYLIEDAPENELYKANACRRIA
ncbi:MAG: hypothetical protein M3389_15240 [Actinomycetota bacterium]|nr:hypothetical protein [Actinomycetota bacterium]